MNDLKFALRQLLKNPGFSAVAILSLALGISANVVVLGWAKSLLFDAIPGVGDPDRIAAVVMKGEWGTGETMSYPNLRDLGAEKSAFVGAAASDNGVVHVRFGNRSEWAWTEVVTANYFDLLAVTPSAGRLNFPANSDSAPGSAPQVVLSEKFWRRLCAADPDIVGKTVTVNQHLFTVIGVADRAFKGITGGLASDMWIPMAMQRVVGIGTPHDQRGWSSYHTVVRLQSGVTVAQADAAATVLGDRLSKEFPNDIGRQTFGVVPSWRSPWGGQAIFLPLLQVLALVAGLVMVLVVANLGNLLFARATVRQGEMAVRQAIGASRSRLVRQLLTESLLLAFVGGVLAVLLSMWGMNLLRHFIPATHLPISISLAFNWQLLLGALAIAVGAGLLLGLAPALQSVRASLPSDLNNGSRSSDPRGGRMLVRRGLVVAQVGLALVVLVSASLCVKSLHAASRISLGFDPHNVWLAGFRLGSQGYDATKAGAFFRDLRAGLLARPGVTAVAFGNGLPLGLDGSSSGDIEVPGHSVQAGENRQAQIRRVSPGYFAALRTPILSGREFRDEDDKSAQPRLVINQAVAERFFPGRDPLGLKATVWGRECEIIGVVATGKYLSLGESPRYAVWLSAAQMGETDLTAIIRTDGDPRNAEKLVAEELKRMAPSVDAFAGQTLENFISPSFMVPRIAATLTVGLAVVALVLSMIGIYAIISFQVLRRRREMGIRMALGARRGDVFGLVLSQAAWLAGAGLLLGLIGAFPTARLLGSVLIGVDLADPAAFAFTAVFLALTCLGACWFPARRAARIDPIAALRAD